MLLQSLTVFSTDCTSSLCVFHKPLVANLKKLVIRPDPGSEGEEEGVVNEQEEDKEGENEDEEVCIGVVMGITLVLS